jgi:hypothetical protein
MTSKSGTLPPEVFPAMIRKTLLSLTALLMLAGCATTGGVQAEIAKAKTDIATFTLADLDQAIAMAGASADAGAPYRARCYTTLKKYVAVGQTVGQALTPKGVVSGYEALAELDAKIRSGGGGGIPADVHADCAVIVTSMEQFAIRIGAIAAGAAGGAPGAGNVLQGIPGVVAPLLPK